MEPESKEIAPTNLQTLFADESIRVCGTLQVPLFRASDLAAKLNDKNYMRALNKYEPDLVVRLYEENEKGRSVKIIYLTECGAYQYLLQSKSERAKLFQRSIYKIIQNERVRVVDEAQLAMRLAETAYQRDREAWRVEREELRERQLDLELKAFDRRWGPTEAEKEYMGLPPIPDPDDWDPLCDYE